MTDLDDLIAEAREAAVRSALWDIPHLLFRLADALESATRVPVQGEPQPQPCSTCGTKYTACTNGIFRPNGKACCSRCAYTDTHQVPIGYEEKQVTQEKPNGDRETLHVSPSIQAVRDYLDQLEDWEAQNHVIEELLSLVDDIPCCESATAMPHDEHNRATVPDAATELRAERDAALARIAELEDSEWATLVQPCETHHGLPYDFEHCETHDRTFSIGGKCDHEGLSYVDYQDRQHMLQRARAVKAEARIEELEARIAEAAKLHRPILASWMKGKRCDVCLNDEGWNETWPCPTAVSLGLNDFLGEHHEPEPEMEGITKLKALGASPQTIAERVNQAAMLEASGASADQINVALKVFTTGSVTAEDLNQFARRGIKVPTHPKGASCQ